MLIDKIRQLIYEPKVRDINVDDKAFLVIHSEVLRRKPLLRSTFETFYSVMTQLCDRYFDCPGVEIELGSGVGFLKNFRPGVITSDIRTGPGIDMEIDALAMSLADESVRCIYAINVFHHLSDPELFFEELIRVLGPGGGCILIEPHGGFASAHLHRYLHRDEHFDVAAPGWRTPQIGGPLSGANQALAEIVFQRDLDKFKERYGDKLEIVHTAYALNYLRYLASGGLNFRQLLPSSVERALTMLERICKPLSKHLSLHKIVVIRRRLG